MSKRTKIIFIVIGIILLLFLFVRPPLVRMYCQKQLETEISSASDVSLSETNLEVPSQDPNNPNDPQWVKEYAETLKRNTDKEVGIYTPEYQKEVYEKCLHTWGE